MPTLSKCRKRFALEIMEERIVPAYNLTIDGNGTNFNLDELFNNGTTFFTAFGAGAKLTVGSIEAALAIGDVSISTGSMGIEAGNIDWPWTALVDDLDYFAATPRTLTIRPHASSTVGQVTVDKAWLNLGNQVNLVIDTTLPDTDGAIRFLNTARIVTAANATLNSGTNSVQINSSINYSTGSGLFHISGSTFQSQNPSFSLSSTQGSVRIDAAIDVSIANLYVEAPNGTITLNGSIDGNKDLKLNAQNIVVNSTVGNVTPLNAFTFKAGIANFSSDIHAATINVGDNINDLSPAWVSGTGTLNGNVVVNDDGNLAPGGIGIIGTLDIVGALTFAGGDYALDLGASPDKINLTGNVIFNGGNLGDETSTGVLAGPGNFEIIDLTGSVGGFFFAFANASPNQGVNIGSDAVQVTNYGPAATGVTIAQVAAAPGGTATGVDLDGTSYKIALTGGGTLAAFTDSNGRLGLAARGTTLKSKITASTKGNASDELVTLGSIGISGDLGSLNAAKFSFEGNLTTSATVGTTGAIKSLTFLEVTGSIDMPAVLSALTVLRDCDIVLEADAIGKVKIGGILSGGNWNVNGGIASITAARIDDLHLTAGNLVALAVTGNKKQFLSGDINDSTFRLTGNDGTPKAYGLKSLVAKGTVDTSIFDVELGSVGTVTVGRFIDSRMHLDYIPMGNFNTGGTFGGSLTPYRLEKFTTTAATLGDANNPRNWAFAGSEIAADTIGTIKLSGLKTNNNGTPFGIKFRNTAKSVQAKSADNVAIALNKDLTTSGTALAANFFFLDV